MDGRAGCLLPGDGLLAASLSTQWPISTMASLFSATSRESAGKSSPRVGCCQRTAPRSRGSRGRRGGDGLVVDTHLVSGDPPAQLVLEA